MGRQGECVELDEEIKRCMATVRCCAGRTHSRHFSRYNPQMYDCDFNQQLGYAIGVDSIHMGGKTVFDVNSLDDLLNIQIRTDNHCFGCTAGMGSS